MPRISVWTGFLCLAAAAAQAGKAPGDPLTDATPLETILVTATRTEKNVFESPQSVSVLTPEDLRGNSLVSLAEQLRDIPGVQILDASVPGMKRIEIRGEASRRNVILIDGQEITDHSSFGTPFLIDPSAVARVEVVRGPSSVLHGSKAIGGVVNIITKKGGDALIEGEVAGSYFSATQGQNLGGSVLGAIGNWDYRLTASRADHEDRDTGRGELEGSSFSNNSISAHLGFRADRHYFALKAESYNMKSDSYVDPATVVFPVITFDLDFPKRDRRKFAFFYDATDLASWLPRVHLDAYHQTVDRLFLQDFETSFGGSAGLFLSNESDDEGTTDGVNLQFDTSPHRDHLLIFGAQYQDDRLDAVKTSTRTVNPVPGIPITTITADDTKIETSSFFAQDEWILPGNFTLLFGARYYDVDADLENSNTAPLVSNNDSRLVSSIGLTYTGFDNHVLRLYGGQGYVYPTLLQLFIDSPFGSGGITFSNPGLDPETSDSIELGWRFQSGGIVLDSTVFYTEADNYLTRIAVPGTDDVIWENIDEATTYGLELLVEWNSGRAGDLTPYINGRWLRREFVTATFSTYKTFSPELVGRAGVRFDVTDRGWADLFIRGATEAEEEDETGITDRSDSWATLNLILGIDLGEKENTRLSLQLNNITDKDYEATNELPGIGRSIYLTARLVF